MSLRARGRTRVPIRMLGINSDHVLVDMIVMRMVKVAFVQVVDVVLVTHGQVTAIGTVLVGVLSVMLDVVHTGKPRLRRRRMQALRCASPGPPHGRADPGPVGSQGSPSLALAAGCLCRLASPASSSAALRSLNSRLYLTNPSSSASCSSV